MEVKWLNQRELITFKRPKVWFTMGARGTGKSSFLEHLALQYVHYGKACIIDLFGSRDGENLAWIRSSLVINSPVRNILLIRGENMKIKYARGLAWRLYIEGRINDISWPEFRKGMVEEYDFIISSNPLYSDNEEEYRAVNHIIDQLYQRYDWKRLAYVIVREASNLYYSRLKVSKNQAEAKANFIYLIRESRHMGLALGLDTIRFKGIDADVRAQVDYFIIKNMGSMMLPDEMRYLYKYFDIIVFQKLPPYLFIIATARGNIGLGYFSYPKFHKREGENIFEEIGLVVEK